MSASIICACERTISSAEDSATVLVSLGRFTLEIASEKPAQPTRSGPLPVSTV